MKVLHLSSATSWRGGEQQITYLIEGLNKLGVKNHVFAPKDAPLTNFPNNLEVTIHTYRKISSFNPILGFQIKSIAETEHIDIIHIHDSHSHNYFVSAAYIGLKTPAVLSRRVDFSPSSGWKYNHPLIKKIICVSSYVGTVMSAIIDDKNKLVVINDGVDLDKKILPKDSLRKQFQIPDHYPIIANISALAEHKDYPTFINTVRNYIQTYGKEVIFLIIGADAGEKKNIEEQIASHQLGNQIIITGFLDRAHQYLGEIDIFLFTSKEEGMGSTLLDAMLYGTPIVSTDAGGIKDLVVNEKCGLICPVGDSHCLSKKIHLLLHTKTLRNAIIKGGLERVVAFSKEVMAKKTHAVYLDIN